ncbi:MAG TPA: DUF6263 family protein [Verrucomicrobiae bacterium]
MFKTDKTSGPAPSARIRRFPIRLAGWFGWAVCVLLALAVSLHAEGPDERYLRLYAIIDQADALSQSGETNSAKAKYREAQNGLLQLKQDHPTWNTRVVAYRLNYIAGKLADLSRPPSTPVAEPATSSPLEAKAPAKLSATTTPAQVRLIEPGAEPRRTLRLQVKPGDRQTVEMITKTAVDMGGATAQAMKPPTIKMLMDVTVKGVSAEGDVAHEMVIADAGLADEAGDASPMAELMKGVLGGLKGMTSTGTTSHRGLGKTAEVKGSAGDNPLAQQSVEQMKDAMSRLTVPLPEEAIGIGAKWEVKQVVKSQGMTLNQTTTYEWVSAEGDLLKMKSTHIQQAGPQKIQNPAMPGATLALTRLAGEGVGELSIDLTKLLPVEATLQAHSEATMAVDMAGQKQNLTVKTDTETRLKSK